MDDEHIVQDWGWGGPYFYPIKTEKLSTIPTTLPATKIHQEINNNNVRDSDNDVVYTLNVIIERECLYKAILIIISFLFLLIFSLRIQRQNRRKNSSLRYCCQLVFSLLNLLWMFGCTLLLTLTVSVLVLNRSGGMMYEHQIEELIPWYFLAIFACCLIEMIEELLFGLFIFDDSKIAAKIIVDEHEMLLPYTLIRVNNSLKLPGKMMEEEITLK